MNIIEAVEAVCVGPCGMVACSVNPVDGDIRYEIEHTKYCNIAFYRNDLEIGWRQPVLPNSSWFTLHNWEILEAEHGD